MRAPALLSSPKIQKTDYLHLCYERGQLTWNELWMCLDELNKEDTGAITHREIYKSLQKKKVPAGVAMQIGDFFLTTVVKLKLDKGEDINPILKDAYLKELHRLKSLYNSGNRDVEIKKRAYKEFKKLDRKFKKLYEKREVK